MSLRYRMPAPILRPRRFESTIGDLRDAPSREQRWRTLGHPATRYAVGFPLPSWQRPLVWTRRQSARFIESAWLGLHLGTLVVNGVRHEGGRVNPLSGLLVDGQQRLAAIAAYLDDRLEVFGYRWSELGRHEQARFERTVFMRSEVSMWQESELRDLYDRLNFGGTPHDPRERLRIAAGGGPGDG